MLSLPHPLFQCQNMIFFLLGNPSKYITRTLNTWIGYSGWEFSFPSPPILFKEFHWKSVVFVFPFDALLFGYSGNSVLFLFSHILVISFGTSGLDVFGPRSPKGSFGTVSVMSSAENGCVPSHLSILGTAFSSVAKEQEISDN